MAILAAHPCSAADLAWTGLGNTLNWSDDGSGGGVGNWGGVGIGPSDGDRIIFNAASANENVQVQDMAGLTNMMICATDADGTVTLGPPASSIGVADGGYEAIRNNSNQDMSINLTLDLNGDATIVRSGTGVLNPRRPINLNGHSLTLRGNIHMNGIIQGAGDVLFRNGNFFLLATQTYTGRSIVHSASILNGNDLPTNTALEMLQLSYARFAVNKTIGSLANDGTINNRVVIDAGVTLTTGGNNTSTSYIGDISDTGQLTKTGSGTMTIGGATQAALVLDNGTLVYNGTSQNSITILGGTLMGTGTCNGLLWNTGGNLSPGNSIGTFNAADGLTLDATSTYLVEVGGTASDRINVTGAVMLNAAILTVTGTPTKGASFVIINNDGGDLVGGAFNGLLEGATFMSGGYQYQITYAGSDGNDVVLTALTGVPPAGGGGSDPEPEPAPAPDTPPAPQVPQGSGPSPTGCPLDGNTLSWPYVKGATHYRIYRAECPLCPRREIGRTTENSFVDNTAIPGQPYAYWLRSENHDGPGVYSNWMAAWRYEQNPGRAGDFNGDGVADLLWWDRDTGQITIWFMSGGQVIGVSSPMEGLEICQWLLIGTSDFNGDGACDLLWWKPETGEILFWYMQPAMAMSGAPFQAMSDPISQTMPAHAALSYPGDLNGDGFTDLLWRDYSNGDVTVWLMGADGKPVLSGPPVPVDDSINKGGRPGLSGTLQWQVAGLRDMDGDGKADVIWQDERNNRLVTWLMDGVNILRAVEENKGLDTVWRLPGVGDLNGDRQADIVWRNEASGEVKAWLMQAGVFSDEHAIVQGSEEATQWQVKAMGDFCAPDCDDVYLKHSESKQVKILTLDGREFVPTVE